MFGWLLSLGPACLYLFRYRGTLETFKHIAAKYSTEPLFVVLSMVITTLFVFWLAAHVNT